jgi:hypothetical protein
LAANSATTMTISTGVPFRLDRLRWSLGGLTETGLGVDAERTSPEEIAAPLTAGQLAEAA